MSRSQSDHLIVVVTFKTSQNDICSGQNKLMQYIQMIQKQVFQLKEMRLTYCFTSFSRIRTIRLMSKLFLFFKQLHEFHLFESTRHP